MQPDRGRESQLTVDRAHVSMWYAAAAAWSVLLIGLGLIFKESTGSLIDLWTRSETYTHGFMILPISLWLVWQRRVQLLHLVPRPALAALLPFLLAGGLWLVANLAGVLVVEQVALVSMLLAGTVAVLGWRVAQRLAFPLLFLYLLVPMGADLVEPMMEFTASFTVWALQMTGVPVYRDGLWFALPSGNWSVVEACSGVRYLIASVTLGLLYAYLSYHTLWKRVAFVALAATVPVLANGIRAYMIVMIGHLSDMRYATGVDHLIYGWLFFGLVMLFLFWIGSFWVEEQRPLPIPDDEPLPSHRRSLRLAAAVLLVMVLADFVAGIGSYMQSAEQVQAVALRAPPGRAGWILSQQAPEWHARHLPTDTAIEAVYEKDGARVSVFVALYAVQTQAAEAINYANFVIDEKRAGVRVSGSGSQATHLGEQPLEVSVHDLVTSFRGDGTRAYRIWQWYRIAGHPVANSYLGKAIEVLARLYPGRADGAWIALASERGEASDQAVTVALDMFMREMQPAIDAQIEAVLAVIHKD